MILRLCGPDAFSIASSLTSIDSTAQATQTTLHFHDLQIPATLHQQELSAARQPLSGELSRRLQPLMDRLAQMLALVEVGIDFSEEDVTFISADQVNAQIEDIKHQLQDLYTNSARFERLTHE